MERLARKLAALTGEQAPPVRLERAIDLTTAPSAARASFPYPALTPAFEVLERDALTAALGAAESALDVGGIAGGGAAGPGAAGPISETVDVSSGPGGVCRVTANVFGRWNAHAGTHADQPAHWLAEPPFARFDDRQYQGVAVCLDLAGEGAALDRARIERAAAAQGVDLAQTRRLLLRTYARLPGAWDAGFTYLTPDAARWLASLERLVLLGTDAPSVDAPSAAPIAACSHGGLWEGRIAILENLDLTALTGGQPGVLQVVWNPMMDAPDARGASAFFHPMGP